jgi:hypothetical protein
MVRNSSRKSRFNASKAKELVIEWGATILVALFVLRLIAQEVAELLHVLPGH